MKRKMYFVALIALLGFGIFYWFELRPSNIRRNCEFAIFSKEGVAYKGSIAVQQNNKYRQCLIKNGLAPESLFVNTDVNTESSASPFRIKF